MADLYNLLGELEENEAAAAAAEEENNKDHRRITLETAAMSEYQEEEDDDDGYALETPASRRGRFLNTPRNQHSHPNDNVDAAADRDAEAAAFFADLGGDLDKSAAAADLDGATALVANELYAKLHRHWLQERHCPELLAFDADMFQELMEKFESHQEGVDELISSPVPADLLMGNLAQQDIDRAKFVLSDWLTQRLNKIEQYPLHNLQEKMENMSEAEQQHLEDYVEAMKKLLNGTVLNNLQQAWRKLDDPNMIDEPDCEGYHFWLVKEEFMDNIGEEHEEGVCLVAKYLDMKEHMIKNKVELLI
jgi:hypothetical protein